MVEAQVLPPRGTPSGFIGWLSANKGPVLMLLIQYALLWVLGRLDLVVALVLAVPVVVFKEIYTLIFGNR